MNDLIALYVAGWVLIPVTLAWTLARWFRSSPRFEMPKWRSRLAFVAFMIGGLSAALYVLLILWALLRGGFAYYDPALLRSYGIGLLLGLAGFALSLPAKGKLRWPACAISAAMMFMWLVAASME